MIGHCVEDLPHAVLLERIDKLSVILLASDFRIQLCRIDPVVAMQAAGARLHVGRCVNVGETNIVQIWNDGDRIAEGEAGVKLKPVGGFGKLPLLGNPLENFCNQLVEGCLRKRIHPV